MKTLSITGSAFGPRTFFTRSALIGTGAWILALWIMRPDWGVGLFLLAPLVLVPLGLGLVESAGLRHVGNVPPRGPLGLDVVASAGYRHVGNVPPRVWQVVQWLQPPAALLLAASFAFDAGPLAAGLALPWGVCTLLIALVGMVLRRPPRALLPENLCENAGLFYLLVGGSWAVLSRGGVCVLGFSDVIIQATAIHFHYAGFVLPLLTAFAGQVFRDRHARVAARGVIAGVPLVAVGITLSAWHTYLLEWLSAWLLAAAGFLVAGLQIRLALRAPRRWPSWFLILSGLSLSAGMALAAVYALGRFRGSAWIEIPAMFPTHGALNALGFALPGLLAWRGLLETSHPSTPQRVVPEGLEPSSPGCRPGVVAAGPRD